MELVSSMLYSDFLTFFPKVPFLFQDSHPEYHIIFSCHSSLGFSGLRQFLWLCRFDGLDSFEEYIRYCIEYTLSWGWLMFFSWLDWGYEFLRGRPQEWHASWTCSKQACQNEDVKLAIVIAIAQLIVCHLLGSGYIISGIILIICQRLTY